ncbi:MAG: glycosyltransferase [Alphaproteobacteria bacterium]|nr:glycosyltransferase [Alphaproteobacteria bacterium]
MLKMSQLPVNVHVLVDLEWSAQAGGHVKCWERFAKAAIGNEDVNLTVHFSGKTEQRKQLTSNVAYEIHKPVFSTRRIPFLGHVPDHTDMASFHPGLAQHLIKADVIHTTDAFFAFAKTAERIAAQHNIPLVHSVHTDSVAYSELFTRSMLEQKFGFLKPVLIDALQIPQQVAADMRAKLEKHQRLCVKVLTSREEDRRVAAQNVMADRLVHLRLGIDREVFKASIGAREKLNQRFSIPADVLALIFVGRLDEGKNIYVLIDALEKVIREGLPVFLIAAGVGPAASVIEKRLNHHAACVGFLQPGALAEIYASADFMALPSHVETWSMVAAEALACGLPVIAAAQSGVGRFIGDKHAGELVMENSSDAWADALKRAYLLRNDRTLRDSALQLAAEKFPSWKQALVEDLVPVWQGARR